jgi:dTDP-4-dehydrorhamnose 3,5-epimerase
MDAGSPIPGVSWGRLVRHEDSRGAFREIWRADAFADLDPSLAGEVTGPVRFVQSNLSSSKAGVLRGLHLHRRQLDHWVIGSGHAFVALVDARPMIAGADRPIVETRVADADTTISIPVGVAHGFLALTDLDLIYFVTNEFDGSDELGFAWDDPVAAIPWPPIDQTLDGRPILSGRDVANPSLSELVERIRKAEGGART